MRDRAESGSQTTTAAAQRTARTRFLLLIVRLIFVVLLVVTTMLTVASTSTATEFDFPEVVGAIVASAGVGLIVLLLDAMTPNKQLVSVVGVYLGICLGLVAALALGALIDTIAGAWGFKEGAAGIWVGLVKVVVGLIICYLSVSIVLTTKDDFRLVIPYVEFSRQVRGAKPLLVDSSALIDGRLEALVDAGLVDTPVIVPQFVIDELQSLADSSDRQRRPRGRRGLDVVARLQGNTRAEVRVEQHETHGLPVDRALVELSRREGMRIATTDSALAQVAQIAGVDVLNMHDLAGSLRPTVLTGERMSVEIARAGEQRGQGVGYLADGAMLVVEGAADRVGQTVECTVTNTMQTAAGRIIFAKAEPPASGSVASMAHHATTQSRPGRDSGT